MTDRFYVGSVTGFPINVRTSSGNAPHKPSSLYYVVDSVPPRPSLHIGMNERGKEQAEALRDTMNRRDADPGGDPPVSAKGRCVVCKKHRPDVAKKHGDPFCSSACARKWHKVEQV